jgi:cystathionine beta-lyase
MATGNAQLDRLDLEVLRARKSEKWNTYPADVLPAWVAEMDFPLADPIARVLQQALDRWDFGYPIALRETGVCDAFAARMADRFDWSIDPRRVEVLSEVVQGLFIGLEAYSGKGEGAVVQTPIYPPFLSAVEQTGRRLVENRLVHGSAGFELDIDGLAAAVDGGTRVLMLCNPHNPTGRVYTRSELEALAEIVLRHDLVVLSDEIHCDLLYDGRAHIPFATLAPELAARTVTLNSASKAFNIPGLRCAVAHFGSAELQQRFNSRFPRHVRGGVGILGLYASIAAWNESQAWLDEVVAYLQSNRDHLREQVATRWPQIGFPITEGTYLAWLDCRALELEREPAAHCLRHGRVALSAGRGFGSGWERYMRVNFATSREILDEVITRMQTALDR